MLQDLALVLEVCRSSALTCMPLHAHARAHAARMGFLSQGVQSMTHLRYALTS